MSRSGSAAFAERADRLGRTVETILLVFVLGAMILIAAAQIVLRNIWGTGLDWADETLRIMVLWVTMLGAVAASRDRKHVSIDALSHYLPPHITRWTSKVVNLFTAAVCAVLAWYSVRFVIGSYAGDDRILGGQLPAWTVQVILPVGFALLSYRYGVLSLSRDRGDADSAVAD